MSVSAVLKAFPVAYEYVTGGYNPYKYDYVRIQSGEHTNELYGWMNNTFVCIGSASPISDNNHTHTKSQITDFPTLGTAAAANTGTSSGNVPVLDANGKLNTSILPALAISDTFVVASQTAMLALTAEVGDVAIRTDLNKSFILKTAGASTLANWQELLTPTDLVSSVAGKTGAVTLVKGDVGLGNVDDTADASKPVSTAQQTALNLKANIDAPTFTGIPKAPTATASDNSTQIATTGFVKAQGYLTGITKAMIEAQLTGVISTHSHSSGTPSSHANTHITGGSDVIANAVASGNAGLMSGADKAKLDGVAAGAEVNVQSDWTAASGDAAILNKPTKLSDFTNDSGFITKSVTIGTVQPTDGTMWYKEI